MEQYFAPLNSEEVCWIAIFFGVALFICAPRLQKLYIEWQHPVRKLYTVLTPKEELEQKILQLLLEAKADHALIQEIGFEDYLGARLYILQTRKYKDRLTTVQLKKIRDKITFCLVVITLDEKMGIYDLSGTKKKLIDIQDDIVRIVGRGT